MKRRHAKKIATRWATLAAAGAYTARPGERAPRGPWKHGTLIRAQRRRARQLSREHGRPVSSPPPTVALDTNVLITIISCHDLLAEVGKENDAAHWTRTETLFRKRLAKSALLVAWLLHRDSAVTFSLPHEGLMKLLEKVPPEIGPRNSPRFEENAQKHWYTTYAVNFFFDWVVPRWRRGGSFRAETKRGGDRNDDVYVTVAKGLNIPLITNEGVGATRVRERKKGKLNLRGKARAQLIPVYSSDEYVAQFADSGTEQELRAALVAGAENYLREEKTVAAADEQNTRAFVDLLLSLLK